MLVGDAQIVQVGAFQGVGVVDGIGVVVMVVAGVVTVDVSVVARLGTQCCGKIKDVVVDGALEVAQGRDEGGFGVLYSGRSVSQSVTHARVVMCSVGHIGRVADTQACLQANWRAAL